MAGSIAIGVRALIQTEERPRGSATITSADPSAIARHVATRASRRSREPRLGSVEDGLKVDSFENEWRDVAIALGIAAGVLLLVAIAVAVARRKLRNAAATANAVDDFLLDLANRTKLLLLILPSVALGARVLTLPAELARLIGTFGRLSLIAQGAYWSAGLVDLVLERYRRSRLGTDPSAVTTVGAFRFAALVVLWSIALLVALDNLGVNITALVTGLGVGGIAVALATQNILGDLFASLSIVLDKPFVVGDFIRVGDDLGAVERIGLKTTRLRSLSGEQLIFSNSDLLGSRIRNYHRMEERRVLFRIGIVYETPPEMLERIPQMVREIIESASPVRFDRSHFASFGDSSYDFEFVYFVGSPEYNVYMDVQQQINLAIVRAFARDRIEFAYPTRTLHIARNE